MTDTVSNEQPQTEQMRDEWVPGLSKGRRVLKNYEVAAHLQFGRQIHTEGNESFSQEKYETAYDRYCHGVQLLCWVTGPSLEDKKEIDNLLLVFYKNQAQAALHIGKWNEALTACNNALKLTSNKDYKALYRKSEALQLLGKLDEAEDVLNQLLSLLNLRLEELNYNDETKQNISNSLPIETQQKGETITEETIQQESNLDESKLQEMKNDDTKLENNSTTPNTPREETEDDMIIYDYKCDLSLDCCLTIRETVKLSIVKIRKQKKIENNKIKNIMKKTISNEIFTHEIKPKTEKEIQLEKKREEFEKNQKIANQPIPKQKIKKTTTYKPHITLTEAHELLDTLLPVYESASFQYVMDQIRVTSDFNERRIIIRARKVIPEIIYPFIKDFGFDSPNLEENRIAFDNAIAYYRIEDDVLNKKSQQLFKLVLGEVVCD